MELDPEDLALLSGAASVYDGRYSVRSLVSAEARKEYDDSAKGRERDVRYAQGEAGREAKHRQNHTDKQREHRRKYARSAKGRASNLEAVRRYRAKKKATT